MPSRQKVFILISFRIQIAFWLLSFLEIYVISLLNGDPQKKAFLYPKQIKQLLADWDSQIVLK